MQQAERGRAGVSADQGRAGAAEYPPVIAALPRSPFRRRLDAGGECKGRTSRPDLWRGIIMGTWAVDYWTDQESGCATAYYDSIDDAMDCRQELMEWAYDVGKVRLAFAPSACVWV